MKPTRRRIMIVAAVVLGLFLTVGAAERSLRKREGEWVEVVREDLVVGVEVTGTLAAIDSTILGPPQIGEIWDFKISQLTAEGTSVNTGQPVIGFDTSTLQRELQQKAAEAESAKKQLEKTQAELLLNRENDGLKLAEAQARLGRAAMKLESPADVLASNDRRKAELEHDLAEREAKFLQSKISALEKAARQEMQLLQGRYVRAQQRVSEIQQQIAAMTVRAPRQGTVVHVSNWQNEKKKVGDSTWRGEKIVEIPDLSRMKAKGEVDEADAGKIRLGQRATFRLDAHPDEELKGKIELIANTVQRQSPRRPLKILKVDISVDRTDPEKMRPGMRFRGLLEIERVPQAIVIPLEAIINTAEGPAVVRKRLLGSEQTRVRLGKRSEKQVQVVSGLSPGDKILVRDAAEEEESS